MISAVDTSQHDLKAIFGFEVLPEVARALSATPPLPVVALESTIVAHGLLFQFADFLNWM